MKIYLSESFKDNYDNLKSYFILIENMFYYNIIIVLDCVPTRDILFYIRYTQWYHKCLFVNTFKMKNE